MEVYQKHISCGELAAAAVLYGMLLMGIVVQFFFGGGVLPLILFFAVLVVVFSYLVFVPERYELQQDALRVFRGVGWQGMSIPYHSIWALDTVGTIHSAKWNLDTVEVILKYQTDCGRNRSISCHPKNVLGFVKSLKAQCPNLVDDFNTKNMQDKID